MSNPGCHTVSVVLVSACVVPSAPLLLPGLVPEDADVAMLRDRCVAAVRTMLAAAPERVVVVGGPTAGVPVSWFGRPNRLRSGPGLARGERDPATDESEPATRRETTLGAAVSRSLLDAAGWAGPAPEIVVTGRDTVDDADPAIAADSAGLTVAAGDAGPTVAADDTSPTIAVDAVGLTVATGAAGLTAVADRVATADAATAVLAVADLSAAMTEVSPRRRNDASIAMSAMLADAIAVADTATLAALDPGKAEVLAIEGGPAFRFLAAAAADGTGAAFDTEVEFRGAPFGVEYIVAAWWRRNPAAGRPGERSGRRAEGPSGPSRG